MQEVELAAEALGEATDARNQAIVGAVAAGHSYREVASAAGLTHPTVASIIRDYTSDREAPQPSLNVDQIAADDARRTDAET